MLRSFILFPKNLLNEFYRFVSMNATFWYRQENRKMCFVMNAPKRSFLYRSNWAVTTNLNYKTFIASFVCCLFSHFTVYFEIDKSRFFIANVLKQKLQTIFKCATQRRHVSLSLEFVYLPRCKLFSIRQFCASIFMLCRRLFLLFIKLKQQNRQTSTGMRCLEFDAFEKKSIGHWLPAKF